VFLQHTPRNLLAPFHRDVVDLIFVYDLAKFPPARLLRGPDGVGDLAEGLVDVYDT
jgi:hypothetical protein